VIPPVICEPAICLTSRRFSSLQLRFLGSTEFHVLRPTEAVLAEYVFHFVRQQAFRDWAASAFVGTGGLQRVPPEFLARVKLPLPTIPEQQRIVDVLRQAESLGKLRIQFDELVLRLKSQLFVEMFGDPNPKHNKAWPVIKLGSAVTVATGGTPPREQIDSYGGKIAWAKSTDLTDDAITSTEEGLTESGIQRSNAKVYPKNTILLAMYGQGQTRGRTAKLLIEAACNQACAALLPSDDLLPDYLWVWLQLSYENVRSLGRGGQQENLNLDIVRNLSLPKPPVALQQQFSLRLDQLLNVEKTGASARKQSDSLLEALRVEALTGLATETWRHQHREEIIAAAQLRDSLLRELGAKLSRRPPEPAPPAATTTETNFPARSWLLSELSDFQRLVLNAFLAYPDQPLLAEDPDVFAGFCDSEDLAVKMAAFPPTSPNHLRRTLSQLAALGLIAKVTLPKTNPATGEQAYLTAFRPLRPSEQTRAADVATLRRSLDLTEEQSGEAAS
jgi:type I restriction enzyme S subunit